MDKNTAHAALNAATAALKAIDVRFWISCGTLLGAIREGDFLEHDEDLDLATWDVDRHAEIEAALLSAGFAPYCTYGTPERGYEQRFEWDGLRLDVFYFYDEGETCWQGSWSNDHLLVSQFGKSLIVPTKPFAFRGLEVPVPADPEGMLEARYGDWRTPKKDWDWSRDPVCITEESRL